ncbi:hypothetical protein DFH09DRAFT_1305494 [Mycena vulgaris]|nr:hypothetical protein DFH09DRAFT_1305494 [Mycena vulgaris]
MTRSTAAIRTRDSAFELPEAWLIALSLQLMFEKARALLVRSLVPSPVSCSYYSRRWVALGDADTAVSVPLRPADIRVHDGDRGFMPALRNSAGLDERPSIRGN